MNWIVESIAFSLRYKTAHHSCHHRSEERGANRNPNRDNEGNARSRFARFPVEATLIALSSAHIPSDFIELIPAHLLPRFQFRQPVANVEMFTLPFGEVCA
jgi:hypothetical protein